MRAGVRISPIAGITSIVKPSGRIQREGAQTFELQPGVCGIALE
jgi:hypothetical protein